jgi:uncharacterized protein
MTASIQQRVQTLPWDAIGEELWRNGYALTPPLLNQAECTTLAARYRDDSAFRSQVVMSRFGFGRGEYKYFKSPLPQVVAELRESCYTALARIVNGWARETGGERVPETHDAYLEICRGTGQHKPTPLLLKYETGDFNCLHQDLYGDVAFPLQMTLFLSRAGEDYTGGEFVLVEQRPRMQSRAMVVTADQGQAVIFPTRYRMVRGTRSIYRTNIRHGVSELRSGERYTLGVIFHDAK